MTTKEAPGGEVPAARSSWSEAAERLRGTARVFVVSLGAVAATVVAGLSLTGLGTLDPDSASFAAAVIGALLATLGVVAMLALAMRLASASAVTMAEMLELDGDDAKTRWLRRIRPGYSYARKVVNARSNGYLAGYSNLAAFSNAVASANRKQRETFERAAANHANTELFKKFIASSKRAEWYDDRLQTLVEVASYQRLRWNFGLTALLMTVAGAFTAVGIVTYAAALQPRDVPAVPVAVAAHERIQVQVPDSDSASALFTSVVGCERAVDALVLGTREETVTAITIPSQAAGCRSVTLTAEWDGTGYVATFDLLAEPAPPSTP